LALSDFLMAESKTVRGDLVGASYSP
jgi:hypothetical protein